MITGLLWGIAVGVWLLVLIIASAVTTAKQVVRNAITAIQVAQMQQAQAGAPQQAESSA